MKHRKPVRDEIAELKGRLAQLEAVVDGPIPWGSAGPKAGGGGLRSRIGLAEFRIAAAEKWIEEEKNLRLIPEYSHYITTCKIIKRDDDGNVKSEKDGWRWLAHADRRVIASGEELTIEAAQAAVKAAIQNHFWFCLCNTSAPPSAGSGITDSKAGPFTAEKTGPAIFAPAKMFTQWVRG